MPVLESRIDTKSDPAFNSNRTIIRADNQFIAVLFKFFAPENQLLVPETDNADNISTTFLECAQLRIDRCHPESAADTHNLFCIQMAGDTHGPNDAKQSCAFLAALLHLPR